MRKNILSHIAVRWRDFKMRMTRQYVFGSKQNDTPCTKYKIIEEWVQFKESRLTPECQGTFVAQRREDLLVAATGLIDRPGRVRAVVGAIGLRDYFGPKPRSTEVVTQEIVSSIRQQVQVKLEESMGERLTMLEEKLAMITQQKQQQQQQQQQEQQQQSQQEDTPTDDPTASRVSTKSSCSTADRTDYNIQYEFLVDEAPPHVVVVRRQIAGGQTIHGAPLLPTHVQVYRPEKQPIAQPVNEAREEAEDHDAISILTSRLNKLRKGPVEMRWELRTFGLECHVPLYINFNNAYEIIGGEKMLNISCIQLWCMYMDTIVVESGRASIYGFLEPQTIQPSVNTLDSRKSYIQTWMTESNREIYIAPYIDAKIKAELKSLIQTGSTLPLHCPL
ncbi:hypothetical protein LR48_Vigan11g093300 [Vigna angularis]|uniref:Uncharacterized protein n=1 Tax=Phaseolus angularis TaxID=3914 RepID=A0A0L9VS59_PHAAN|nr:hypothetical protein LR48_Vigan11g093300 [Vigna angularis]